MTVRENISLSELTTMMVGGVARYVFTCENNEDIRYAMKFVRRENLAWFVLGEGSNVIANGDFDGVIILNRVKGFEKVDDETYKIGAGENWDKTVEKLCKLGLSGAECLSLIPGLVGSFPVQNVGAYGQDISQVLLELTAYDVNVDEFVTLPNAECAFGYRNSIFKGQTDRHLTICDVTLRLSREFLHPPFYDSLQEYLNKNNVQDFSPMSLRHAVIAIRNSKLPPVDKIPSAGSFFKNPILSQDEAQKFLLRFPDAPHWASSNGAEKLSAGWLIDQAGLRGYRNYGFQIYPDNTLVITNINNGTDKGLSQFRTEIIEKVQEKFGITLRQEPENLENPANL
ncbi:UDP-N-acetylmuramate dehydrogenase [Candidatus Saccharibacteria bacterium]|nr:UDP-N-acetylmuramate dehydrogenase [Candidatus Saccharibacteria bacterium]MCL1963277.1 UDP-N-acetylmuramate dehydrogenase [Candidatus Saccharibacteria bacterium]